MTGAAITPTIRPIGSEGERTFITEATCHARRAVVGQHVPWSAWLAMYSPAVREAVREGLALVADLEGVAVGFLLVVRRRVMMVYVKQEFRGLGIGAALLAAALDLGALTAPIQTTADMLTPSWRAWCARKGLAFTVERAA